MPKKPRFNHPVRKVRKAIGVSQKQFANLIGCKTPTVHAIENGLLPLSLALEARIYIETGANTQELVKGKRGKPLDQDGQPYSKNFYKRWKAKKMSYDRSTALKDFETVLEEASRFGRLPEVLVHAQEWFYQIREILREPKESQS